AAATYPRRVQDLPKHRGVPALRRSHDGAVHELLVAQPDVDAEARTRRVALGWAPGHRYRRSWRAEAGGLVLAHAARDRRARGSGLEPRPEQGGHVELPDHQARAHLR